MARGLSPSQIQIRKSKTPSLYSTSTKQYGNVNQIDHFVLLNLKFLIFVDEINGNFQIDAIEYKLGGL